MTNFQKEYFIKQIILYQQKTPGTSVMTPVFLEGFSTDDLNKFLDTVRKGYVQGVLYNYLINFLIFLSGYIVGKII